MQTSQVAHQARAYLGFYSMERLGGFLLSSPPGLDTIAGLPPALNSLVPIDIPG